MTTQTTRKGIRSTLAALALATAAYTANAEAVDSVPQQPKPAVEKTWASLSGKSLYATNAGVVFNPKAVIQSDLGVVIKGVSADVFSNYNTTRKLVDEHDFTVSKTFSLPYVDATPSLMYWTVPHQSLHDVKLVSLALSPRDLPLGLQARVSGMQCWSKESHGHTADVTLSRTFDLSKKLSITPSYTAALNHRFYNDQTGFAAHNLGVNATYDLGHGLSLNAGVTKQIAAKSFNAASSQTIYGLGISKSWEAKK